MVSGITTVRNPIDGRSKDFDHFKRPLPRSVELIRMALANCWIVEKNEIINTVWIHIIRLLLTSFLHFRMLTDPLHRLTAVGS